MGITLTGRGLWYGAVDAQGQNLVFTQSRWEALCKQAKSWGITVVHPKVAEGVYPRYTDEQMKMLRDVAKAHSLLCVPYTFNYGDALGGLVVEARLAAHVGSIFGAVCIDPEDKWETYQSIAWATKFGQVVRQSYTGPIYVTTFGQPAKHPSIPWVTFNSWMAGYLPQVYWSEWQEGDVSVIIPRVYQQWLELDKHCRDIQKKPLAPISPIIELGQSLPQSEVATWLRPDMMGGYGYCGFWYADTYAPYAATILKAPMPARRPSSSRLSPTSLVKIGTEPSSSLPSLSLPEPLGFSASPRGEGEEEMQMNEVDVPSEGVPSPSSSPSSPSAGPQALLSLPSLPERGDMGSYATVLSIPVTPTPVDPTSLTTMIEPVTPLPLVPVSYEGEVMDEPSEKSDPTSSLFVLTPLQYRILWQSRKPDIFFDEGSPVVKRWCEGIARQESIGVPVAEESEITIEGEKIRYVPLTSNKTIIYFYSSRQTLVI